MNPKDRSGETATFTTTDGSSVVLPALGRGNKKRKRQPHSLAKAI